MGTGERQAAAKSSPGPARVVRLWRRLANVLNSKPRSTGALGRRGEDAAARHLRRRGYRVLARNVRGRMGEVDIVCEHPDRRTIVFVEVKTRRSDHISPAYAVNTVKRRKLRDLSLALARRNGWEERPLRIDVVTVVWPPAGRPVVTHLENVIAHDGR